ncbi:MAG TPA: hypothetical protein VK461_15150, partial [Acidimicrobiales bacterium]|nr:hypothetical protein [Acidimicrobiales bacterium]
MVASVSITWGAGVAFATDSPSPIDQSNDINVNASVGTCEPGYPENPTADEVPVRCVNDAAIANSGKNLQGNEGQANITGQAAVSVGVGHQHHGDDDAFALGLYFGALALGGDGFAIATNKANSDNNADVTNHLQTGAAEAKNTLAVDGSQSNKNTGDSVVVGLGSGAAGISQSNGLAAIGDNNLALANTGKNIQGSGGQLNLTGQLALAGAAGSSALALSLGVGIAAGGN